MKALNKKPSACGLVIDRHRDEWKLLDTGRHLVRLQTAAQEFMDLTQRKHGTISVQAVLDAWRISSVFTMCPARFVAGIT